MVLIPAKPLQKILNAPQAVQGLFSYAGAPKGFRKHELADSDEYVSFDAVTSYNLDRVRDMQDHFIAVVEGALEHQVDVVGDVWNPSSQKRNHFLEFKEFVQTDMTCKANYRTADLRNVFAVQKRLTGQTAVFIGGILAEELLTYNQNDPSFVSLVRLGDQTPIRGLENNLLKTTNPNQLVFGFHWGTVAHNNWIGRYWFPDRQEETKLQTYAQREGLFMLEVADSILHMAQGNNITRGFAASKSRSIPTTNAKSDPRMVGTSMTYIPLDVIHCLAGPKECLFDMVSPLLVYDLKNGLLTESNVNKRATMSLGQWWENTGRYQSPSPFGRKE